MGFDYIKVKIVRNIVELLTFKLSFVLFWSILPIWVVVSNQSTSKAVDDLLVLMSKGLDLTSRQCDKSQCRANYSWENAAVASIHGT